MVGQAEVAISQLLYGGAVVASPPEVDQIYLRSIYEPSSFAPTHEPDQSSLLAREAETIPTKLSDLVYSLSNVYDLSVTAAQDLSIPVIGSVSGGQNRRVVVLEAKRWNEIELTNSTAQYGYAIRLAITTNKLEANMKLNLAYLAAAAQVGMIEASWTMYCIGLSGKPIDDALIPPKELSVETFVLAKQSLEAILKAVWDPETKFSAVKVAEIMSADQLRKEYFKNIARAYALGRLERGRTLAQAINDLGTAQPTFTGHLSEFYKSFAGIVKPDDAIPSEVRQRARAFLQTVDVVTRS